MKLSVLIGFATFLGAVYFAEGGAELKIEVLHKPEKCTETVAESGQNLVVHYTGRYLDGKKFDSSFDRGHPYGPFQLGNGDVILGYDRGLPGMCVGEKRRLTIPPHLAYGERGYPDVIPPSATLVFDVELLSIEPASKKHDEH